MYLEIDMTTTIGRLRPFESHNSKPWHAERKSSRKRHLSTSCNDHLRYEYAALEKVPALLSLPFELLERILDEVALNSVSGLRPFACASRICRALSRPYCYEIPKVTFNEVVKNPATQSCIAVSLRETDNYKTLDILSPCYIFGELACSEALASLRPIKSVLGNQNSYTHVRFLIEQDPLRVVSPAALEKIYSSCPMISQLTLALSDIQEFCFEDGSAGYRSPEASALINVISRFNNLQSLELRFGINKPNLHLLYPQTGTQIAEDVFTRVQGQKHGLRLSRLDIVFSVSNTTLFGCCSRRVPTGQTYATLYVTMSCFILSFPREKGSPISEPPTLHCDLPIFGIILDRKKQVDRLVGPDDYTRGLTYGNRRYRTLVNWEWEVGPRTWKYVCKEWPHPPEARMFYAKARTMPLVLAWYCGRRSTRRKLARRLSYRSWFGPRGRNLEDGGVEERRSVVLGDE